MFALDDLKSADATAYVNTQALSFFAVSRSKPCRVSRKLRSGHRELDEPPHFFDVFLFDKVERVEVFYLTRDSAIEGRGVELRDATNPVDAGADSRPVFFRSGTY